jgi:predicted SAM-dependent methyltransferase/tetratricopeptide (TPR) repeat protein
VGCGLVHRPDWINLDRHTTDAADLLADAVLLPFQDGSTEAIEAFQLIEHLGYVGTLYALHEWARVLAPGGTLRVETPDRAATLRAALSEENDQASLPWLFGLEQRGLTHRYLFSADELAQMATKAGFADVKVDIAPSQPAHPTLKITARRAPDNAQHRFANRLHRAFIVAGLVKPTDTLQYLSALETLCERATELIQTPGHQALLQLLSLSARYSPRIAACVLGALPASPAWPDDELARARSLVADLEREQFPARMACRWRATSKLPGTADAAWASLEREISLYLAARLYPNVGLDGVRAAFDAATAHPSPAEQSVSVICRASLTELARRLTARGVRAFARGNLELAAQALEAAVSHDPALIWPRWNLARLYVRDGRLLDALEHYEALQADLPAGLRPRFEHELDAVTGRDGRVEAFVVPLADPADLLRETG